MVNTVGPFAVTAPQVARACPPGTHYLDVANELSAFEQLHAMDREAAATGRTVVSGRASACSPPRASCCTCWRARTRRRGYGSTPSPPSRSRPATLGEALAATLVHTLLDGGREVRQGRLVRAWLGGEAERVTTPDGDVVVTASLGSGELFAAWRASGAPSVVGASALVPAHPAVRAALPAVAGPASAARRDRFRRPAARPRHDDHDQERPRRSSWARARVEWPSGRAREGWLRTGRA